MIEAEVRLRQASRLDPQRPRATLGSLTRSIRLPSQAERVSGPSAAQMKVAVLGSDAVTSLLSCEHLPALLRPFAWLGTLRPSDAAGGVIAKLGASLPPAQRARLESTKVRVHNARSLSGRAFDSRRNSMPFAVPAIQMSLLLLRRLSAAWHAANLSQL